MGAHTSEWGEWVLGDLADTLVQLADLLGKSTEVTWVSLTPPGPGFDPRISIAVPDRGDLPRLRDELGGCGRPVQFDPAPSGYDWYAAVPGLARLRVEADQ